MSRAADRPPVDRVDCVVIGAGVVGLAIARALAIAGRDVTIVEAASAIGTGISSRNSEVIHAGLYYPPGSSKARLCVRGREMLYAYCAARHIPHRRIGKLLIATDDGQSDALARLADNARASGVEGLRPLRPAEVTALEPALSCAGALWSPDTGIVDSHALMLALLADAEAHGAVLACSSRVTGGAVDGAGIHLVVAAEGADAFELRADLVVNSAGLDAARVARSIEGFPADHVPSMHYAKGHYFSLTGRPPFQHLVYPLPEPGGLGIHVTLDLDGAVRFGPDVEWLADDAPFDFTVDPARAMSFAGSIRKYWPALDAAALAPAYAGIRPKLSGPGEPPVDFAIVGPADHGVAGLIHLFGIESPGLTSSLAIAEVVAGMADAAPSRPNGSVVSTMQVPVAPAMLRS